jgi:hypothetical protein
MVYSTYGSFHRCTAILEPTDLAALATLATLATIGTIGTIGTVGTTLLAGL